MPNDRPQTTTTWPPAKIAIADLEPAESYDISDRGESDSEGGSDGEDDSKPRKPVSTYADLTIAQVINDCCCVQIPEWARSNCLREALEKQFGLNRLDPDQIFPEVHTCDLEDVFDSRKKRYVIVGCVCHTANG